MNHIGVLLALCLVFLGWSNDQGSSVRLCFRTKHPPKIFSAPVRTIDFIWPRPYIGTIMNQWFDDYHRALLLHVLIGVGMLGMFCLGSLFVAGLKLARHGLRRLPVFHGSHAGSSVATLPHMLRRRRTYSLGPTQIQLSTVSDRKFLRPSKS